ncbi:nuclear transport factor 2 family protein [Algimonas porphyrae]|uniref:SnoaL-like domain-containing protein n=1 Tax=Algimonas porphyrae TaxID=1128113 RepID=A0ABQ5V3D1_9PROT|nr:nuclear transport factor 2 family protein [Algimonas porphyrae]GLQ21595.1 hypothetical protein GCM10007854_25500 [Algimonas porphyrae]
MTQTSVNLALVKTVYEGFAAGDMPRVLGTMADDIVWNEAQGNPYADQNPYVGPEAILTGLFARLGGDWENFTATPSEFILSDDTVIVFGTYTGRFIATGKAMNAPFVHRYTVRDGKIAAMQQYTDTAAHVEAMGA